MSSDQNSRLTKATMDIMKKLLGADTLDQALSESLSSIVGFLDSEAGILWFLDKKTGRLFPVCHSGPDDISGVSIQADSGLEGVVISTGKPVRIEDASQDPRFEGTVFDSQSFKTSSMMLVPLTGGEGPIGLIEVINKKDGALYTEDDLTITSRMAAVAAMTIEEKGLIVDTGEEKNVLISLREVTKEYPSGDTVLQVLKGINLDIYENEFVVVLGESGCGKSTMMNIIGGMDNLTSGTITIEGKDYSNPSDAELTMFRRQYLGFIFQQYNLMPNLTALENVQFIAEIAKDPIKAEDALAKVGLSERAGNYPAQLSGGQQQRVSIARALVKNPRVILADEPTAALDFASGQEVLKVIEDIVRNQGTTVVMVTHNVEIAKMANRVVNLRAGKIASIKWNLDPISAEEIVW
ncbi:MAG: ATP-binding cassette domain-containing protein [Clostridiales bacterium]|nr:ATP-binding cassette domain-containing protein [Clostridiales bacterium]